DWDIDETDNTRNYCIEHATAITEAATSLSISLSIDSASNEATTTNSFSLAPYSMVDWLLGQEGGTDSVLTPEEKLLISIYRSTGAGIFVVSGSDIASKLTSGTIEDQAFLQHQFRAQWAGRMTDAEVID